MKKLMYVILILLFAFSAVLAQDGKISGKVYFDYSYDKDQVPTNSFEIHRAYFGYKKALNDNVKFEILTDVGRMSADDRLSVYLKSANINWKTGYGNFIVGLQSMNVFKAQEHNWGYRYIYKSAMDQYKWSSSADLGFGYKNKLAEKLHFWAVISNGTGYKHKETDKYKKYSVQLLYGDSKLKDGLFNAGVVAAFEPFKQADTIDTENKTLLGAFGAFQAAGFRAGAEFDIYKNSLTDVSGQIISLFGDYKMNDKTHGFARVDIYDPNTDADKDGKTVLIGGVNFVPESGLYIGPNIQYTSPQTGDSKTVYKLNFQFKF